MANDTQQHIFEAAKRIFAEKGYDGLSMRALARDVGISLSVIYHHYPDKDILLREIFNLTNTELGRQRAQLSLNVSLDKALKDRIEFQFSHMQDIVFVLKYYLHFRDHFEKNPTGWVPEKTSLHIEEILRVAERRGELRPNLDIAAEAKVVTHAINGFLLEYYPAQPGPKEQRRLVCDLHTFIYRSLVPVESRGAPMLKA